MVEGEKMFSLLNNSYRKVSQLKGNQCCVVKWMFYLNEVMPPAINHLVTLPWTFFSLGRHDWLLKAGKVYLHWSHSTDLRLSAISFEFKNIYLDGFHMTDVKLLYTLQILKLFLLFLERTNGTVIFFIRLAARSSSQNVLGFFFLFFCSEEVASYFKRELPNLANSGDQLCLRHLPSNTACGVVYRAVVPVFSAPLGPCMYAEGEGALGHVCPFPWSFSFPLCLPCLHQQPQVDAELHRDTGGGVWLCNRVQAWTVTSSLLWREGMNQNTFNLALRLTAGPCCALNWCCYLKMENAKKKRNGN